MATFRQVDDIANSVQTESANKKKKNTANRMKVTIKKRNEKRKTLNHALIGNEKIRIGLYLYTHRSRMDKRVSGKDRHTEKLSTNKYTR